MKIIGLLGYIGSGKGTVADRLVEKHGYHKINFADTLKDVTAILFGWDRAMLEGDTEESRKARDVVDEFWTEKLGREITPRGVLQNLGTEIFREAFDENIWVTCLEKKLYDNNYDKIIVADTRFPNECEFILKNNDNNMLISVWKDVPEFHQILLDALTIFPSETIEEPHKRYLLEALGYIPHMSEIAWVPKYAESSKKLWNNGSLDDLYEMVDSMLDFIEFNKAEDKRRKNIK